MNVRKAVKTIVALATGLTMIGATIMGASALSLSNYPAPFIQNGQFNGKIVVGANAQTSDVLGAIDISASLQAQAKTAAATGASATTTVEGGVLLKDSNTQNFNFGDTLSTQAFDSQDFPTLMKDGVLTNDDGTDYDFTQSVALTGASLQFSNPQTRDYDNPVMSLNLKDQTDFMTYDVDFTGNPVDLMTFTEGETLNMFGTSWTIGKLSSTTSDVILYGSDVTQTVSMNTPVQVDVNGTTYTLNIIGANSNAADGPEVHVSVNGDVLTMKAGDKKTFASGLQLYAEDVFVSNVGTETASAKLFVGSKELNLGHDYGTWTQVQQDGSDVNGVSVQMTGNASALTDLQFQIDPTSVLNPKVGDGTDYYDWLAMGDTFVDPLFGFKLDFTGAVPSFTSKTRDYVDVASNGDDFDLTFTNEAGNEYSITPYHWDGSKVVVGTDFVLSGKAIQKNDDFILYEDASSAQPVSRVFELRSIDSDGKATFKDLSTGQSFIVSNGSTLAKTGVTVTSAKTNVTLSQDVNNTLYTQDSMMITLPNNFTAIQAATNDAFNLSFKEDAKNKLSNEVPGSTFTAEVHYDSANDNEFKVAAPVGATFSSAASHDNNYDYGVSKYGTYFVQDANKDTELQLYVPPHDVVYDLYLSGPSSVVTTVGSSSGAYDINPIGVGIGVLDTNAPALGSTPMLVVGGPCANTVAAELMGNPTNCLEGFEQGKAIIKLYESQNAILVAGYSAMDTQGASRVLANPDDWSQLSGSEVEVLVPSLSSISINPVA